jgi:branched-chain amino acid transport system ATP-binding protein
MTVGENLALGAFASGWRERHQRMDRVLSIFPKLAERRKQLASTLSGGERQMVSIGIGLMSEPKMLMLDEPTLGLAPKIREELSQTIRSLAATGVTLMIVDQDLEFLQMSTQRSYLLEGGRIVLETDLSKEISDTEILKHYFGSPA